MAVFSWSIQMAPFTTIGSATAAETLAAGQIGFIAATAGVLVVASSTAVDLTATSILTVAGGLQADSFAAKLTNGGQVNVGSTRHRGY
jgi:hypothetical protein